jgi:hypothetical protein
MFPGGDREVARVAREPVWLNLLLEAMLSMGGLRPYLSTVMGSVSTSRNSESIQVLK